MTATRIYLIESEGKPERLVRASSPAQAIRHAAKSAFTAAVATPDDTYALATAGVKVEHASEEKAE